MLEVPLGSDQGNVRSNESHGEKKRGVLLELRAVSRIGRFFAGSVFQDRDGLVGGEHVGLSSFTAIRQDHARKVASVVLALRQQLERPRCERLGRDDVARIVPRVRIVGADFAALDAAGDTHVEYLRDPGGVVAAVAEKACERRMVCERRRRDAVVRRLERISGDAVRFGVQAAHERGTGGPAERVLGVGTGKADTLGGEAVEVGSIHVD